MASIRGCKIFWLGKWEKSERGSGPVQHLQLPRSGFAAGVEGDGGYADVKLLLYADLGKHVAFDGTVSWLIVDIVECGFRVSQGQGFVFCGFGIQGDSFANYWRGATDFGWL